MAAAKLAAPSESPSEHRTACLDASARHGNGACLDTILQRRWYAMLQLSIHDDESHERNDHKHDLERIVQPTERWPVWHKANARMARCRLRQRATGCGSGRVGRSSGGRPLVQDATLKKESVRLVQHRPKTLHASQKQTTTQTSKPAKQRSRRIAAASARRALNLTPHSESSVVTSYVTPQSEQDVLTATPISRPARSLAGTTKRSGGRARSTACTRYGPNRRVAHSRVTAVA